MNKYVVLVVRKFLFCVEKVILGYRAVVQWLGLKTYDVKDTITSTVESVKEDVEDKIDEVKSDVEEKVQEVKDEVNEKLEKIEDRIEKKLDEVEEKIETSKDALKTNVANTAAKVLKKASKKK